MKSQATLVATHKDEKPNILQEPTNQPILSQQTPSYTLKSSKVPSSIEASLKDDGSDTNDDTAAKKSKGRKMYEEFLPTQHYTIVPITNQPIERKLVKT